MFARTPVFAVAAAVVVAGATAVSAAPYRVVETFGFTTAAVRDPDGDDFSQIADRVDIPSGGGNFDVSSYIYREYPQTFDGVLRTPVSWADNRVAFEQGNHRLDMAVLNLSRSQADYGPDGNSTPVWEYAYSRTTFGFTIEILEPTPFAFQVLNGVGNPLLDPDRPADADHYFFGNGIDQAILNVEGDGISIDPPNDGNYGSTVFNNRYFGLGDGFWAQLPPKRFFRPGDHAVTGTFAPGLYTFTFEFSLTSGEGGALTHLYPTLLIPEPATAGLLAGAGLNGWRQGGCRGHHPSFGSRVLTGRHMFVQPAKGLRAEVPDPRPIRQEPVEGPTMTATTPEAPASYLRLAAVWPPHPITDAGNYARAAAAIDALAVRDEGTLDAGEQLYLEAVTAFIGAYDDVHYPPAGVASPLAERMTVLMEERGLNQSRLAEVAGCPRSVVSDVMAGRREFTRDQIRRLTRELRVSADYFL